MKKLILTSLAGVLLIAGTISILSATGPETRADKSGCSSSTTASIETATSGCTGTATVQTASLQNNSGFTGQTASVEKSSGCTGQRASAGTNCTQGETKTAQADVQNQVQMVQTSSASTGCTGATQKAANDCSGSAEVKIETTNAGECTKVPSGISGQQANRNN